MSRRRGLLLFLIATGFGLMASVAAVRQVERPEGGKPSTPPIPTASLVLASRPISPGTPLSADNLQVSAWPKESVPPQSFPSVEKVKGRVSAAHIRPGQPILEGLLAPEGSLAGLGALIPSGYRAMTVRVDDVISVGGFVSAGDRVDVLVTLDPPAEGKEGPGSRVILQNIPVLVAGREVPGGKEDARPKKMEVITLLVTPEGAERLALASARGRIQLALRNGKDEAPVRTPGVTAGRLGPNALVETSSVKPTRPSSPGVFTLEVIRGGKREVREFEVNSASEPLPGDPKVKPASHAR